MHSFASQRGSRKLRDQGGKAFALLLKRVQKHSRIRLLIAMIANLGILVVARQRWSLLLPDALDAQRPVGHFVDHVAQHLYRRPLSGGRAMPQRALIGCQCAAKGTGDLAELCSPASLFGLHAYSLSELIKRMRQFCDEYIITDLAGIPESPLNQGLTPIASSPPVMPSKTISP